MISWDSSMSGLSAMHWRELWCGHARHLCWRAKVASLLPARASLQEDSNMKTGDHIVLRYICCTQLGNRIPYILTVCDLHTV